MTPEILMRTILFAEENEQLRAMLPHIFGHRYSDHVITVTGDHRKAAELVRKRGEEIELLVTNLGTGPYDGLELLEDLRRDGFTAPVILFSGFELSADQHARLKAAGQTYYVLKDPTNPFVGLVETVKQALRTNT